MSRHAARRPGVTACRRFPTAAPIADSGSVGTAGSRSPDSACDRAGRTAALTARCSRTTSASASRNCGRSFERGRPPVLGDARTVRHLAVLAVELGQGLDVVARERDRHHQHVLLAAARPAAGSPARCSGPSHRTGPTSDWYASRYGLGAPSRSTTACTLAPISCGYGSPRSITSSGSECALNRMQDPVAVGGIELLQSLAHRLGHRGDEPVVHRPAIDDAPLERILEPGPPGGPPELVQARAGGAAGELGILGEGDGALDAVRGHRAERILASWAGRSGRRRRTRAVRCSGERRSSRSTMPWPWARVYRRIGEPPPMLSYRPRTLGARRRAMKGPSQRWNGSWMISRSAKSSSRKGSTSARFAGPPRFIITMPVFTLPMRSIYTRARQRIPGPHGISPSSSAILVRPATV